MNNTLSFSNKTVFGITMRNPEICQECIERILNRKISKVVLPEIEKTIDLSFYSKAIRLDVYCADSDDVINVEMQNRFFSCLPKRGRYYQSMMDRDILDKGDPYTKLKKNIVIFICRFDLFGYGKHIYTFENRCIDIPELAYGDETMKIVLNTKGTVDDISTPLKRFLDYIETGEPMDEYTEKIETVIDGLRNDRRRRDEIMTYEQEWEMEKEVWHEQWKEEGLEEGREEGRDCAYIKFAKKMSMRGSDDAEIKDALIDMFDISDEKADYIICTVNNQNSDK